MARQAALLLALVFGWAQAISYTVQVVALSEQAPALDVQRRLLEDSFPAYVVRASVAQGDIYRVRVGAFANREAAVRFALAMPVVSGGPPLPALAEGIPPGVMPLEPRIVADLPLTEVELLDWPQGVALRSQPDRLVPATYVLVRNGQPVEFEAWNAAPAQEGVLRLRNLVLWPSNWEEQSGEQLAEFLAARLQSVARELDLSEAELESLQRRPVFGPPFLVVLEQFDPAAATVSPSEQFAVTGRRILGVAATGGVLSGLGPQEIVLGSGKLPASEVLYRASPGSRPSADRFAISDWSVREDGAFFVLDDESGGTPWRAGVGAPLWSDGSLLLTRTEESLLLYDFVPRE